MNIYVTTIRHDYGFDTWIDATRKKAISRLAKYCRNWWTDEITSENCPRKNSEVVDRYFELCETEYYDISVHKIQPPQKKISAIQKQFLKEGGNACPYCGEDISIDGEQVDVCFGSAVQEVSCNTCGRSWMAHYKLYKFE